MNIGGANHHQQPQPPVAQAQAAAQQAPPPPRPTASSVNDERRMRLSRGEHARALQIKSAVEADQRIHNLSDFEYVQWSITTSRSLPLKEVCERVYFLQCFRQEYNISDDLVEAANLLCTYATRHHPLYLLSFDYLASSKNYALIADWAQFHPHTIQTHDDFRTFLGTMFYIYQAGHCDFTAIRGGLTMVFECMDSSWANYDQRVVDRWLHELFVFYPKRDEEYYYVNSPTVVNVFYGLIKRFIPEDRRKAFQLGYQTKGMEETRLDTLYNVPTPEVARHRTITKVCEALQKRYQNQQAFSLSNCWPAGRAGTHHHHHR